VLGITIWQIGFRSLSILQIGSIAILLLLLFAGYQSRSAFAKFSSNWGNGVLITIFLILFGYSICSVQQTHMHPNHYSNCIQGTNQYLVKILEPIVPRPKSFKTIVAIQKCIIGNKVQTTIGNAYLYFTKTKDAPTFLPGDELIIQANPVLLQPNTNPGSFDYAGYSLRNGITHSIFIGPNHYQLLAKNKATLSTFFARQKIKCLATLHRYITHSAAIGIADALLVGDRSMIDEETWNAYKDTGIVHVIAISGMHLGLVYHQLTWLLFLIPLLKRNYKFTIIISLLAMWIFSCIIGMPPSVARAGVIFTIMGIGKIIDRKNYTYNSLIVSAFILLCIQPNWILDVGFQLSYAAIFGILLFAQKWAKMFYSRFYILQMMNVTIATTMAAQVFTLPICLYYFHQFPILLILSNLIAVFATTIILYAEILLLGFSWFPIIAKILGVMVTYAIIYLNKMVFWLSSIPFFNIKHISISLWQYIFLLIGISFLSWAVIKRTSKSVLISCVCFIVFFSLHICSNWQAMHQQKLIVYDTKYKSIAQIFTANKYNILATDSITPDDVKYILEPSQTLYRANEQSALNHHRSAAYQLQVVNGKSILQLFGNIDSTSNVDSIDYLILCKNANIQLSLIVNRLHPKQVIIDGSNSLWKIEQWENEAIVLHLPIFNTAKQGAFIADL
jgi:competence protein ComEC